MRVDMKLVLIAMLSIFLMTVSCGRKEIQTGGPGVSKSTQVGAGGTENGGSLGDGTGQESYLSEENLAEEARKRAEEAQRLASSGAYESKQAEMDAAASFVNEDVYFPYDSSRIDSEAQVVLELKAEWLRKNPYASIVIEGHCDERGTTEYNLSLGERRAESVRQFLSDLGIAVSRMSTISYGEEKPIAMDGDEVSLARNRRAHFVVK